MTIEYHLSDCDNDEDKSASKPATGEDFTLDIDMYDMGTDWIMPPCSYSKACKSCGIRPQHSDSIIVAIDGACRGNGHARARSTYGVYFSETSSYNLSSRIKGSARSSQRAELAACVAALNRICMFSVAAKAGALED